MACSLKVTRELIYMYSIRLSVANTSAMNGRLTIDSLRMAMSDKLDTSPWLWRDLQVVGVGVLSLSGPEADVWGGWM